MNFSKLNSIEITFYRKRKCLHCNAPIPDQAHAARKFCKRIVLSDSTVKNCKDDFIACLRKMRNVPYQQVVMHHKLMNKNLNDLYFQVGENISLEDIERYGIILQQPFNYGYNEDKSFSYLFVGFNITTIDHKQYKIEKYGNKF